MKKKEPQKHDVKSPYSEWEKICESKKRLKLLDTLQIVISIVFSLVAVAICLIGVFVKIIALLYVAIALVIIGGIIYYLLPFFF